MPLYLYTCKSCGDFREWQSMAAFGEDVACPQCGGVSEHAITAPTILGMDSVRRKAHERNELSAHSPRVVQAKDWNPHDHHHHGSGHAHRPHVHKSSRPWMIGH